MTTNLQFFMRLFVRVKRSGHPWRLLPLLAGRVQEWPLRRLCATIALSLTPGTSRIGASGAVGVLDRPHHTIPLNLPAGAMVRERCCWKYTAACPKSQGVCDFLDRGGYQDDIKVVRLLLTGAGEHATIKQAQ